MPCSEFLFLVFCSQADVNFGRCFLFISSLFPTFKKCLLATTFLAVNACTLLLLSLFLLKWTTLADAAGSTLVKMTASGSKTIAQNLLFLRWHKMCLPWRRRRCSYLASVLPLKSLKRLLIPSIQRVT